MKKTLSILLALVLLLGSLGIGAFAADPVSVRVTIADDKGQLVVANEPITVTDADRDGFLSVSDALYEAHEEFYLGGAAAGYSAVKTAYGLSLMKLWGVSNGGSYGYYLNDASVSSLAQKVKDGDNVYAFVYTDTDSFSDAYSFFDIKDISMRGFTFQEVTLYKLEFDEHWLPVKTPVAGAVITIDGTESKYVTDENGKAKFTVLKSGEYTLSAVPVDGNIITPPVCSVHAEKGSLTDLFSYLIAWVLSKLSFLKK